MATSTISGNSLPKKKLAIGSPPTLGWQSARPSHFLPISGRRHGIGGGERLSGLILRSLFRLRSSLHDETRVQFPRVTALLNRSEKWN
jgi:hypothetical protein